MPGVLSGGDTVSRLGGTVKAAICLFANRMASCLNLSRYIGSVPLDAPFMAQSSYSMASPKLWEV
jgi:hypothetical protein